MPVVRAPRPVTGQPPAQTTAELLARPNLPILPVSELDLRVEDTLAAERRFQKAETLLAQKRWDEALQALQKANTSATSSRPSPATRPAPRPGTSSRGCVPDEDLGR